MNLFGFGTKKSDSTTSKTSSPTALTSVAAETHPKDAVEAAVDDLADEVEVIGNPNTDLARARLTSLVPECNALKTAYDACFFEHFNRWIKAGSGQPDAAPGRADPCAAKLRVYTACLRGAVEECTGVSMAELDSSRMDMTSLMLRIDKADTDTSKSKKN